MSELRWDPARREWVVTATHRQDRTFKPPADYCPFCPARDDEYPTAITEDDYDIAVVENRFPSLQPSPPEPAVEGEGVYGVDRTAGACEVVLFTAEHDAVMSEQPASRFRKLVRVWRDRYRELGAREEVEYVFVFENRGEEMGVTLTHPHGQIYAYPFVPPVVAEELAAGEAHRESEGACLFCDLLDAERGSERVVLENDSFTAFVPFSARYAYEVHVYADDHLPSLDAFGDREVRDLGDVLKRLQVAYDALFGFEMPFVMAVHQAPAGGTGADAAHFHVEFYPPYRTAGKLKHLAGSELGAGTYINNVLPEEAAGRLREAAP